MTLTLRYFEGCPHWRVAEARVREALERLGRDDKIVYERIETDDDASRVGFRGSPTVLIDGQDPFVSGRPAGLSCRVYSTEAGREGAPSVRQLMRALDPESGTAD